MSLQLWQTHLEMQDNLDDPMDLFNYLGGEPFQSARRILDIGAGYGNHTHMLAKKFPDKLFTGIDNDPNAIELAKAKFSHSNITYILGDAENALLMSELGSFDFIIARLLVQHLSSVEKFAQIAGRCLNAGGGILMFDVHEPSKKFSPPMSAYKEIFKNFRAFQRKCRSNEDVDSFPTHLKANGFKILSEFISIKNTDSHYDKSSYATVLRTNLALLEENYNISGDYQLAREEISEWEQSDHSYGSMGDYIVLAAKA